MTLTPKEATNLRHQILRDLQNDSYVEMDSRFLKPIFGTELDLSRWAASWGITYEYFIRQGEFRSDRRTPIWWVSFRYNTPDTIVLL